MSILVFILIATLVLFLVLTLFCSLLVCLVSVDGNVFKAYEMIVEAFDDHKRWKANRKEKKDGK